MPWTEVAPGTFRITAPPPTRGQPRANVYVVCSREGVVVFDPGYGTPRSAAIIHAGLARLLLHLKRTGAIDPSIRLREAVKIVVLSHDHHDHAAGAAAFKRWYPSCRVAASRETTEALRGGKDSRAAGTRGWDRARALATSLVSRAVLGLLGAPRSIAVDTILSDGDVIGAGDRQLHVIVAPGHAPGQVLLHDPDAGWLLSSDLVLRDISTWLGPPRSDYTAYKRSMTRVGNLHPSIIFPAHGGTIHDPDGRVKELIRFRTLRERQIARACTVPRASKTVAWMLYKERGPVTVAIAAGMVRLVMDALECDGVLHRAGHGIKSGRLVVAAGDPGGKA